MPEFQSQPLVLTFLGETGVPLVDTWVDGAALTLPKASTDPQTVTLRIDNPNDVAKTITGLEVVASNALLADASHERTLEIPPNAHAELELTLTPAGTAGHQDTVSLYVRGTYE